MSKEYKKREGSPHWPSFARALKREAKKLDKSKADEFKLLKIRALAIEDPYYAAMAASWIGAQMAEVGLQSAGVFSSGIEKSKSAEPEWRRAEILLHIASDMSKTGSGEIQELFDAAAGLDDETLRVNTLKEMKRRMIRKGIDLSGSKAPIQKLTKKDMKPEYASPKSEGCNFKISLGLYNTYEGTTIKDSHIRAIARAAPLCIAYNLRLALFNFPPCTLQSLVKMVESQTRLKETKNHISQLYLRGCITLEKKPIGQLHPDQGFIVATTSHPYPAKKIGLEKLPTLDNPVCFLMGLGKSGLPKSVLNTAKYHLELTGTSVSLETCTAMGVLASTITSARK